MHIFKKEERSMNPNQDKFEPGYAEAPDSKITENHNEEKILNAVRSGVEEKDRLFSKE